MLSAFSSSGTVGTFFYGLLLFVLPGVLLYRKSQAMKYEGKKISRAVGVSKQEAQGDLQKMIDCGYFQNTYMEPAKNAMKKVVEEKKRMCMSENRY